MKAAGVEQAQTRYQRAEQAVRAMDGSQTLESFEQAWIDFLLAAHGIYVKLEEAAKSTPSQPWFGSKKHDRKNDPLLNYLHHARNAGEHGLKPITDIIGGEKTVEGGGFYVIAQDWSKRNTPRVAHLGVEPPRIVEKPWKVHLAPVTDRGQTYAVPTTHLGRPIADTSPIGVAKLALDYLRDLVAEAVKRI